MILLLSGYDAASHRRWREALAARLESSGRTVVVRALPGRHFRWRIRGNPLEFARDEDLWQRDWDLVIATSAVDVATLRGLVRTKCPWVVYVHENQFAYPLREQQKKRDGALLIRDLYAALAADFLVFNSQFNRDSFVDGARRFLDSMPDFNDFDLKELREESRVIPVGLEASLFEDQRTEPSSPPTILWNHRWEWDKAPETFFRALELLEERGTDFSLNVVGQQFREAPAIFETARKSLGDRIRRWGYQESREAYLEALDESTVVVSTSLHEYQGLAVMEAVVRGCIPVVPNRLAYPNFFGAEFLYDSSPDDRPLETANLASHLEAVLGSGGAPPDLRDLAWDVIWREWVSLLDDAQRLSRSP